MKFDAVGLFVTDMTKMVYFYRDVIGMQSDWNGKEANAELKADGFRLIMYGRGDFEKMTSRSFGYPKDINGTMELAYEVEDFAAVGARTNWEVLCTATVLFFSDINPNGIEPWFLWSVVSAVRQRPLVSKITGGIAPGTPENHC